MNPLHDDVKFDHRSGNWPAKASRNIETIKYQTAVAWKYKSKYENKLANAKKTKRKAISHRIRCFEALLRFGNMLISHCHLTEVLVGAEDDAGSDKFKILLKIFHNALRHLDNGIRFSKKDLCCRDVQPKKNVHAEGRGYSSVSFDEFNFINRRSCIYSRRSRESDEVSFILESLAQSFEFTYLTFTSVMRRNGIAEDDLNRFTLPRKYTDHVSSMPENFGRPQWDEILQIIPFENDVTGRLLALSRHCEPHTNKMKMSSNKPSSSQSTELSLRKSTGATLTKKSDTSSPEKKKRRCIIADSDSSSDDSSDEDQFLSELSQVKAPPESSSYEKNPSSNSSSLTSARVSLGAAKNSSELSQAKVPPESSSYEKNPSTKSSSLSSARVSLSPDKDSSAPINQSSSSDDDSVDSMTSEQIRQIQLRPGDTIICWPPPFGKRQEAIVTKIDVRSESDIRVHLNGFCTLQWFHWVVVVKDGKPMHKGCVSIGDITLIEGSVENVANQDAELVRGIMKQNDDAYDKAGVTLDDILANTSKASTKAKTPSIDAPSVPAPVTRRKTRSSQISQSFVSEHGSCKDMLINRLQDPIEMRGVRVRAISADGISPRDYGIEYPPEITGLFKCHLRAMYALHPMIADMAIKQNIRYKDVDEIKKIVRSHDKDFDVYRVGNTDHWVAICPSAFYCDSKVYPVNNYAVARMILAVQEGDDPLQWSACGYPDSSALMPKFSWKRDEGYSVIPTVSELVDHEDLSNVSGFKVIRENVGQIVWINSVDLRGADITKIVTIRTLNAAVKYDHLTVDVGVNEGLNGPAIITWYGVRKPNKKQTADHITRFFEKYYESKPETFKSYDPETGNLTVTVPHFSEYDSNDAIAMLDAELEAVGDDDAVMGSQEEEEEEEFMSAHDSPTGLDNDASPSSDHLMYTAFVKSQTPDEWDSELYLLHTHDANVLDAHPILQKRLLSPGFYWPSIVLDAVLSYFSSRVKEDCDYYLSPRVLRLPVPRVINQLKKGIKKGLS